MDRCGRSLSGCTCDRRHQPERRRHGHHCQALRQFALPPQIKPALLLTLRQHSIKTTREQMLGMSASSGEQEERTAHDCAVHAATGAWARHGRLEGRRGNQKEEGRRDSTEQTHQSTLRGPRSVSRGRAQSEAKLSCQVRMLGEGGSGSSSRLSSIVECSFLAASCSVHAASLLRRYAVAMSPHAACATKRRTGGTAVAAAERPYIEHLTAWRRARGGRRQHWRAGRQRRAWRQACPGRPRP